MSWIKLCERKLSGRIVILLWDLFLVVRVPTWCDRCKVQKTQICKICNWFLLIFFLEAISCRGLFASRVCMFAERKAQRA